ncbi:zinc finger CCHC domain-containing protein [Pimephales promelas]|nr:zinc finger CCHC domain-containing protein [Pimephales promelas]
MWMEFRLFPDPCWQSDSRESFCTGSEPFRTFDRCSATLGPIGASLDPLAAAQVGVAFAGSPTSVSLRHRFSAFWLRSSVRSTRMDDSREDAPLPTMLVRLKNTVRFQVKKDAALDVKKRFGRDFVVTELLKEVFGISASLIFCLQDFSSSGFMDLTFFQLRDCAAFYEAWGMKKDHQRLSGIQLFPAFTQDFLPLTIHLYNPFVEDGDVLIFLARYCETVKGGERLKDRFGIWTGKRRYLVKLRADPAAEGGLVHPPGSFFIGSNRGFLHYPGQPVYCRRCGAQGHVKAESAGQRCRFCGSTEHMGTACPEPKKCSLCGGVDHLFRVCPKRKKTYASLFKEGQDLHPDFDGLLSSTPEMRDSHKAGPSNLGVGEANVEVKAAEVRNGDEVEKKGTEEEI